ncbi:MAG: glycosyltransferase family 39 protein [Caldilineaceae bacterium]
MKGLPKTNKLIIAAVAILLAVWGQRRLALFNEFDALVLYGLAGGLFLWTFRHSGLDGIGHGFTLPPFKAAAAKDFLRLIPHSSRIVSNNPALVGAQKATRQRIFTWLSIALGGLIALIANGRALWLFQQDFERPQALAWPLYVGSIVLLLAAIWLLDLTNGEAQTDVESLETPSAPRRDRRWLVGALLVILAVGAFMRLYRFGDLPFGTWYDEAAAGLLAQRMMNDSAWRPVFPGSINVTAHYIYLIYTSFELFGMSTQAVRAVSVLMGLAAVPAAYLLGRELYGRTLGLGFALVVAVARWHVNFSRIGMYNIATPLFELLAAGFLLRGIRRNRFMDFGLAGLALGLGLCFYPAFQLFVAALGFFVLYLLITQRGFLRHYWPKLLLMTLLAAMIAGPLVYFAYEKPDVYFARTKDTSLWAKTAPEKRVDALLENTRKHLLMFHQTGDPNGRHNIPGAPMLDTFTAALMALGVLLALRWSWQPRGLLLLFWLLIPLLGGILSLDFEAPQSLRSIGSQPAAYLLAMLPLYFVRQEWRQSVERYFPRTLRGRCCWC